MDHLIRKRRPIGQDRRQTRHLREGARRAVRREGLPSVVALLMLCSLILLWGVGCNRGAESTASAGAVPPEPAAAEGGQSAGADGKQGNVTSEQAGGGTLVLVTYFHTTFRCPTCKQLEQYSRETVERDFAKEIGEGRVAFRTVNVQEPANEHHVQAYNLYTKSLIVSLNRDGKEIRWKNLPDIWQHVRNRERFDRYVREEIQAFLQDS